MTATGTRSDGALYMYAIVPKPAQGAAPYQFDNDVHLVEGEAFAAIVAEAPAKSQARRDRRELALSLLAHQKMIERVMEHGKTLPVKFDTTAPDRESVERCLERGEAAFSQAFETLQGKTQYEVLVTWDLEAVFAEIATDPEVVRLKGELQATPDGPSRQEDAKRLGALVKASLERRRETFGRALADALRAVSADVVVNSLMDDRMVLNLALLVDDNRAGELDACLERLDALHDGRLSFRCVGPLPPHSFAAVEVSFFGADEIARARRLLGLDGSQDTETVRSAYLRLAKRMHPDTAGNQNATESINSLNDAYRTLALYAESGGPVVVKVQRQETAHAASLE